MPLSEQRSQVPRSLDPKHQGSRCGAVSESAGSAAFALKNLDGIVMARMARAIPGGRFEKCRGRTESGQEFRSQWSSKM